MRALPAGIKIRRADVGDIDRVEAIIQAELARYAEWAPEGWSLAPPPPGALERVEQNFRDPERAWVLLAEEGDDAVGVVSLALTTAAKVERPVEGTVYLWQMFVRRDRQGSGLAGALMDRVIEEARSRGFTRMVLWTPEGAAQARRFYEREGWTLTGEVNPGADFGLPLVEYERSIAT
jgi:GNAT superfamily N-acetyltransferase